MRAFASKAPVVSSTRLQTSGPEGRGFGHRSHEPAQGTQVPGNKLRMTDSGAISTHRSCGGANKKDESTNRRYFHGASAQSAEAATRQIVDAFFERLMTLWYGEIAIALDRVTGDAGVTVQAIVRRFGEGGITGEGGWNPVDPGRCAACDPARCHRARSAT